MNVLEKQRTSKDTWKREEYAGELYDTVENYAVKRLFDEQLYQLIAHNITGKLVDYNTDGRKPVILEAGAGRAPISKKFLENFYGIDCVATDKYPDMAGNTNNPNSNLPYLIRDLTDPLGLDMADGMDVAVMQNSWYAVTLPSEGTRKYTEQEALMLRQMALANLASVIQEGGQLVISDPLKSAKQLGFGGISNFIQKEKEARQLLNGANASNKSILMNLLNKKNKDILSKNKKLTNRSHLFNSKDELIKFVTSTGLFELEYVADDINYIGHNATVVFRRTEKAAGKTVKPEQLETIVYDEKIHPDILEKIGKFRNKMYGNANVNKNVPIVDNYDVKNKGRVVCIRGKDIPDFALVATMQQPGRIGLELEQLMNSSENGKGLQRSLIEAVAKEDAFINEKLSKGKKIKIAEIRRLASSLPKQFNMDDYSNLFQILDENFGKYANEENINIVFYLADSIRKEMFNDANPRHKFRKLEGFKLNKEDIEAQTTIISGADYFLGRKWMKLLSEDEVELIQAVRNNYQMEILG
jgi:SAM-dependent methyltransferase